MNELLKKIILLVYSGVFFMGWMTSMLKGLPLWITVPILMGGCFIWFGIYDIKIKSKNLKKNE